MIEIVPFKRSNVPDAVKLEKLCFSDPWDENMFYETVENPLSVFFSAVDGANDLIVGYAGMYIVLDETQIMNIAVSPSYRRNGVGAALMERMIYHSLKLNMALMTLEVRRSNESAKFLYERYGFVCVGIRKGYYRDPTEDALLMNLNLKGLFPEN